MLVSKMLHSFVGARPIPRTRVGGRDARGNATPIAMGSPMAAPAGGRPAFPGTSGDGDAGFDSRDTLDCWRRTLARSEPPPSTAVAARGAHAVLHRGIDRRGHLPTIGV